MPYYGLIGHPIKHSWSKKYFDQHFASYSDKDYHYELLDLPTIECLPEQIAHKGLRGFNVTAPYKERVIPYLSQLSEQATAIGAVNCVVVNADGRWVGYNTDAPAFAHTLRNYAPHSALVLGTGGAAKAVCYALRCMGWRVNMVSRYPMADAIGTVAPMGVDMNTVEHCPMADAIGTVAPMEVDMNTVEHCPMGDAIGTVAPMGVYMNTVEHCPMADAIGTVAPMGVNMNT
ncbi:MAG: hypothetical protein KBT04_01185, partial [Bacteroidales bacterium]|nr:hypothetical protein [Candidatus Colimorpha onthohippi]